jgi:hypothetical protein
MRERSGSASLSSDHFPNRYRKINDFFFQEPGECAGEEGGEGVRGGEGQEEGSLHQGEELPGQALPLQAQDDEGGKLPLGKHSPSTFFSYVVTMKRLDQSSLHPSFKYSYTDMSRLEFYPRPLAQHCTKEQSRQLVAAYSEPLE